MDWILSFVGFVGFYLSGKKVWWSWYVNIACQGLWLTYSIFTQQYGFLVASVFYAALFTRNAYLWTKEHREKRISNEPDISGTNSSQRDL